MKSALFASAAAVAVLFAGAASAQPTGYFDLGYSDTEVDTGLGDGELNIWSLGGKVFVPTASNIDWQFDGSVSNTDYDTGDEVTSVSGTAHAFTRNDAWAFGGFVGLSDSDQNDDAAWNVGVEGHKYFESVTLAGQLSYGQYFDNNDVDFWNIGGEARWFLSDNFRLDARLGATQLESGSTDIDVVSYGVGGEYQFAGRPFSIFAGYDRTDSEDLFDLEADTFSVGVRFSFGGDTLKSRDRSGASFSGGELGLVDSLI